MTERRSVNQDALSLLDVRPEVLAFAIVMEAKLRENDHKGGWQGMTPGQLIVRIREETDELADLFLADYYKSGGTPDRRKLNGEAADIANFAMFAADIFGALQTGRINDELSRIRAALGDLHRDYKCSEPECEGTVDSPCPRRPLYIGTRLLSDFEKRTGHRAVVCKPEHDGSEGGCPICIGGLFQCRLCGQAEVQLEATCPKEEP